MKKNLIGIAVATTLGLAAFAASAEDVYRGVWYAVPGVSYMNTDSSLEANNGGGAFIKLGQELSPSWDIQGGFGYSRASEDTGIAGMGGRYKQTTLGMDALYMLSRDKFRPFLLTGLGLARNHVDYSFPGLNVDSRKTSWMANIGLGAQYLFNDSFGLQVDLRQQWSRAEIKIVNGVVVVGDTDTIGNTLLNVGGIFRFGAPAPTPVAVVESAPVAAPEPAAVPEPTPVAAPEPVPAPVSCTPQIKIVTVGAEKLFNFDQSQLKEEGKAALNEAAAKIKANPEIKLVIVTGHADRIGSDAYNQKLSARRADQVKAYLANQGVAESIMEVVAKGESEPVVQCAGNKTTKKLISCLQPNRRVEIRAEGKKEVACH